MLVFVALMYAVACLIASGKQSNAFASSIASLSVDLSFGTLVFRSETASSEVMGVTWIKESSLLTKIRATL